MRMPKIQRRCPNWETRGLEILRGSCLNYFDETPLLKPFLRTAEKMIISEETQLNESLLREWGQLRKLEIEQRYSQSSEWLRKICSQTPNVSVLCIVNPMINNQDLEEMANLLEFLEVLNIYDQGPVSNVAKFRNLKSLSLARIPAYE